MIVDAYTCNRSWVVVGLTRLEREIFGVGAWSHRAVEQELNAPARTYFLDVPHTDRATCADGFNGGSIRGYAGFWYDGDDAELMTIGVDKQFRGRGIATSLLRRLIESAQAQGARRMLLEVRVDNASALSLYHRFGFQQIGLRKHYYQPENVDAYTMSLRLANHGAYVPIGFRADTDGNVSTALARDNENNEGQGRL